MYLFTLTIKHRELDHDAARAMVNQELTRRFGPDVGYHEHAFLSYEITVILRTEAHRTPLRLLQEWFGEGRGSDLIPGVGYDTGTLLYFREIDEDTRWAQVPA